MQLDKLRNELTNIKKRKELSVDILRKRMTESRKKCKGANHDRRSRQQRTEHRQKRPQTKHRQHLRLMKITRFEVNNDKERAL